TPGHYEIIKKTKTNIILNRVEFKTCYKIPKIEDIIPKHVKYINVDFSYYEYFTSFLAVHNVYINPKYFYFLK
ncbi:unnamed protein product, partial [marine sediment metagenome]